MTVSTERALIHRPMPVSAGARLDAARDTFRALEDERRRLARLGLEDSLARCERQLRFWEFVSRVLSLPAEVGPAPGLETRGRP